MIKVKGLQYSYNSKRQISFQDFEVQKGEHLLLLGESGSGKTTLLHLLGGLLRLQNGTILVNDCNLAALSESELDRFRGKHYGFVFQKNHLITALTVEKNLLMAPFLAGIKQNKERVAEVLEQLGLADKKNARVNELSQGQAQRVAIARAVLNTPAVILADELTSSLDDKNCEKVIELLMNLADQNKSTLVIATHDQRLKGRVSKHRILSPIL